MSQTCRLIQELHSRLSKRSRETKAEGRWREVGVGKESMFGVKERKMPNEVPNQSNLNLRRESTVT